MRILLDVDGVLANFTRAVLDEIAELTNGERLDDDRVDHWSFKVALGLTDATWKRVVERIVEPGFAYRLEPYPEALAAVRDLAERNVVYFVTSPWRSSRTWVHDRDRWLRKHVGRSLSENVVHTAHKELVGGDLFIDDKPEAVQRWARERAGRGDAVLWARPYNACETGPATWRYRTNDWSRILRDYG